MSQTLRAFGQHPLEGFIARKKFYTEFSDDEFSLLGELVDEIADKCFIKVPGFVVKRMMNRDMLPIDLPVFDDEGKFDRDNLFALHNSEGYRAVEDTVANGMLFEFSDEGQENPFSPFRLVWANKIGDYTYFVKASLPPLNGVLRVIDVWRKLGDIPILPLSSQKKSFVLGKDWDIEEILRTIICCAKDSECNGIVGEACGG